MLLLFLLTTTFFLASVNFGTILPRSSARALGISAGDGQGNMFQGFLVFPILVIRGHNCFFVADAILVTFFGLVSYFRGYLILDFSLY